jgi:exosortase K
MNFLLKELFLYPSAKLANFFINGMFLSSAEKGYIEILTSSTLIKITENCSGITFFLISLFIFCFCFYKKGNKKETLLQTFLTILLITYLTSIVANSTRIISAFYLKKISNKLFSVQIDNFVHFSLGTVIFFTFFVLAYSLLERIFNVNKKY